jgi:hypothetical protein
MNGYGRLALSSVLAAGVVTACAGAAPSVRQSCTQRTQWALAQARNCQDCVALAKSPHCDCFADSASGACAQQTATWVNSTECAAVRACVDKCKDDCGCVDACYDQRPACRDVGGAADACVVATCDARCR